MYIAESERREAEAEREKTAQSLRDLAKEYQAMIDSGNAPSVSLEEIDGGVRITVTDARGEEAYADILHGEQGIDGKSAYEYAKEGGFDGTEEDFAKKIAREIPSKVSELENDKSFIAAKDAPVQSVNSKTGAVKLNADDVGADKSGAASSAVSTHNTNVEAHNDIRLLIEGLASRLNALANSTDVDLDDFKEVVAYIKSNRSLIDEITSKKINYTDIIDNLTTNVTNKPLSAAQGVALKGLIDALATNKLDESALVDAINTALAQAKESGKFDGKDGKSAYEYAKSGGYTGTEAEFAEKLAAEWQLKTDKSLKTENKEVVGAINEVAGKTVNRISRFNFASGDTYYVSPTDSGIYWENDETEIEVVDKAGNKDFYYPNSSNCVPIVPGTNVSFTVDDQNKVVEINATGHPPVVATSGSGAAYTAGVGGLNSLYSGLEVTIIPHVNNTVTNPTLNLNGLGAKTIYRKASSPRNGLYSFHTGQILSGTPLRLMYNGSFWIAADHSKPIVYDLEGIVTLLPLLLQAGHLPEEIYDTSNHIYRTMYNPLDYTCQFGGGIPDISDFVSIGITSSSAECTVTVLKLTDLACEVLIEVRGSYDNNSMTWSDIVVLGSSDDTSIDYYLPGEAGQYSWTYSLLGVRFYLY